jgi:hypothetical protein
MTTRLARARSMLRALPAPPLVAAIGFILDHARRW